MNFDGAVFWEYPMSEWCFFQATGLGCTCLTFSGSFDLFMQILLQITLRSLDDSIVTFLVVYHIAAWEKKHL